MDYEPFMVGQAQVASRPSTPVTITSIPLGPRQKPQREQVGVLLKSSASGDSDSDSERGVEDVLRHRRQAEMDLNGEALTYVSEVSHGLPIQREQADAINQMDMVRQAERKRQVEILRRAQKVRQAEMVHRAEILRQCEMVEHTNFTNKLQETDTELRTSARKKGFFRNLADKIKGTKAEGSETRMMISEPTLIRRRSVVLDGQILLAVDEANALRRVNPGMRTQDAAGLHSGTELVRVPMERGERSRKKIVGHHDRQTTMSMFINPSPENSNPSSRQEGIDAAPVGQHGMELDVYQETLQSQGPGIRASASLSLIPKPLRPGYQDSKKPVSGRYRPDH